MKLTRAEIDDLVRRGATIGPQVQLPTLSTQAEPTEEPRETKLVEPGIVTVGNQLVITLPVVTRSEANESKWDVKMRRKFPARRAVRDTLGAAYASLVPFAEAYHAGRALRVVFARLGGRRLDRCNLPSSMKAVEDMVAGALLADDGDSRWHVSYEQDPGGPVGVCITIEEYPV